MDKKFTVEESNLICIFAGESRTEVIKDISRTLKHLEEDALIELSGKALEKLNGMSDEEFARIDLTAAE